MKASPLALAIACTPWWAYAAEPAPSLDKQLKLPDVVVTASRQAQSSDESAASVSVFTREDIDRLQPSSVQELLTHVPGVQIATYGGRGAGFSLSIRGTSSAQSLVLIDGVRVGSATAGGASLQYLSVDQIERIEVLRGSRSALYGADAMGGVVQIFTRRSAGEGLTPRLRIAGGSDQTWERSAGISGGDQQTRFSLNASQEETAGIDRTRRSYDSDSDHDAYRNRSLSLTVSHQLTDELELGLNVLDQRGKTETDNPFGRWDNTLFASFPSKPYDHFAVSSTSTYLDAQLTEQWNSRLELGHSEDKQENFDKLFPGSTVNNTFRDSANWLNTVQLTDRQTLRAGLDYLNDKIHSTNDFSQDSRWNQAGYLQHSYQGELFSTELGVRHDKNQQYGSHNSFNGALGVAINSANQLTLSYAEGFRVPTFADLYWPKDFNSFYEGNPNLKPEQSKTYELKWNSQLAEKTRLQASLYRTDFRDLISFVSDPVTWWSTMENTSRARINGLEASLAHEFMGWQSQLAVSLIDPRDRETGHTLQNRARRTLSFDLDRRFGAFGVGASWQAVSSSYGDAKNTKTLPGYGTVDLRGSWQASKELSVDLKLANLLDKDYSRILYSYQGQDYGYQEPPMSAMLGLTWTPEL